MNGKFKLLFVFLSLLISLTLIASCGDSGGSNNPGDNNPENNPGDNNSGDSGENSGIEETTEEIFIEPDVPEKDYGGIDFNIIYPFWGAFETQLFGDQETSMGTELDDAIWRRNKIIEDRLNINLNPIVLGIRGSDAIKDILPAVRRSVMAGDGSYDMAFIHPMCDLNSFAQGQLVRNWNKMPHVDLTKPYWNQSIADTLEINGVLLFASNDFIIPSPSTVYFNKKLIQDYGLGNPYDYVKAGTWTWDVFSDMAKQVTRDLNGDGIFDAEDLYGLGLLLDGSGMISMMHACEQYIVKKDEGGVPVLDLMSEKLVSLIDKMYDLVWVGNQTYTWTVDVWNNVTMLDEMQNFFPRGHSLFNLASPSQGANEQYRAMEVDFGIVPYPKYSENQEKYISLNHAGLMLVPQDVKDPEMVGIVAELMGSESKRYTIPAYYDVLLTHKGVRDDDSLEMLKIIFDNTVYDFGYNYSNFTNTAYIVPRIIANQSRDVASFYEANARMTERDLESAYRYLTAYEELDF
ncbi:MAG: hypothetical protein FWH10_06800 [Oscillospiraceae bacterium]|nr:hypothetical protein [Oscillospiraceae bacterium]